jgi:hypothetical protein
MKVGMAILRKKQDDAPFQAHPRIFAKHWPQGRLHRRK